MGIHASATWMATLGALGQVPETTQEWLLRPEFRYPLAFGVAMLLLYIGLKLPSWLAAMRSVQHKTLMPLQVEAMMMGNAPYLIDLREEAEFAGPRGHIRGAKNIPLSQLHRRLGEIGPDLKHPVILVDETDISAHRAFEMVTGRGYDWVRVLQGGMMAWRAANMPVYLSDAARTKTR